MQVVPPGGNEGAEGVVPGVRPARGAVPVVRSGAGGSVAAAAPDDDDGGVWVPIRVGEPGPESAEDDDDRRGRPPG